MTDRLLKTVSVIVAIGVWFSIEPCLSWLGRSISIGSHGQLLATAMIVSVIGYLLAWPRVGQRTAVWTVVLLVCSAALTAAALYILTPSALNGYLALPLVFSLSVIMVSEFLVRMEASIGNRVSRSRRSG